MLQARFAQGDPRLYSVSRDVAHNFQFIALEVARRLRDNRWPALEELCAAHGVSAEELGAACQAFCSFVAGVLERPGETMEEGIRRSGFLAARGEAQVAFMACLGQVVAGVYWAGLREATAGGSTPPLDCAALAAAGAACVQAMQTK